MSEHASADTAALIALLQRISAQLDQLPAALAAAQRKGPSPRLTTAERETLSILLPGIKASIGSALFTVRELLQEAKSDEDLAALLEATVADKSAKSLGKLLRRGCGYVHNDLMLVDLADESGPSRSRDGIRWCVRRL